MGAAAGAGAGAPKVGAAAGGAAGADAPNVGAAAAGAPNANPPAAPPAKLEEEELACDSQVPPLVLAACSL